MSTMSTSTQPRNILVVDDDAIIRDMMVDILESYDISSVATASNGHEALAKLSDGTRYLVFLDMMMPLMTGEELCLQLNVRPQLRALHTIVLMSAADQLNYANALGVDAVMSKPFEFEDVEDMLTRFS